jgi:hypothetical protein
LADCGRISSRAVLLALVGLVLTFSNTLYGQSNVTGAISGVVEDSSGAVVPGAVVSATNSATADTVRATTNATGTYQFPVLQPSQYVVTATSANFATTSEKTVVDVGQTTTVNFRLSVGNANQTITVSEEQLPLIETTNADMATTLTATVLQQVPVPGNDINSLLQMAPGAVMTGDLFPAMYGQPTTANLLISNGMEDIDPVGNSTNGGASNLLLGLNEVQEVTVTASAYTGQFGYLAGSNDTIVTRSGSNRVHGNAKYFWNGRALNANDYFNNESDTPRAFVNVNQWASNLGGPIIKDKLFFFLDTEGIRLVLPTSANTIVPSQQFEAATIENLQALGLTQSIPFYCQTLTLTDASGKTVACPAASSGAGQGIFNLYNAAPGASRAVAGSNNPSDPTGCNGFTGLAAGVPCSLTFRSIAGNFNPEWIFAGRVDYNINTNNHIFGHFKIDDGTQASYTDPISSIFNSQSAQKVEDTQFSWTSAIGNSEVNEFDMSLEHFHIIFSPPDLSATLAAFPTELTFGDGTFTTLGGQDASQPSILALTDYHFSDNFSKNIRNHSLKVGLDFTRYDVGNSNYANAQGNLVPTNVDAFFNGGVDPAVPASNTTLTQAYVTDGLEPLAQFHMGGFIQDGWEVNNTLTLTFSLRLDHASNVVCQHDCFARSTVAFSALNHNVDTPYNQALQTGLHESLYNLQSVEWQPRFGFAWQPLGLQKATVVRGGVGAFYDNLPINVGFNLAQNSPLDNTFIANSGNLAPTQSSNLFTQTAASNTAFTTGFTQGFTLAQFNAAVPNFSAPNLQGTAQHMSVPLVTKWSLEVERGLWRGAAITAGYVGNRSVHDWVQNGSVNAYAANFAGLPTTAPDPRFGGVTVQEDVGVSNYNGANVSLADHFGSSVAQINYTYSHALTDLIGTSNPRYIEDPSDPKKSYGNADFDVRQGVTANYVWDVPFARYLRALPKAVSEGWQLSETFYIHSGFPYTVYDSATNAVLAGQNYSSSASRPAFGIFANYDGGAAGSCTSPKEPCLTASQFSSASTGFGNQEQNQFHGPKYVESDLGFMKMTKIGEYVKFGVGAQAYNVFNHPNFAVPDGNLADPTFGQILSAVGSPSSIYGVLGADNSPRLLQIKGVIEF